MERAKVVFMLVFSFCLFQFFLPSISLSSHKPFLVSLFIVGVGKIFTTLSGGEMIRQMVRKPACRKDEGFVTQKDEKLATGSIEILTLDA